MSAPVEEYPSLLAIRRCVDGIVIETEWGRRLMPDWPAAFDLIEALADPRIGPAHKCKGNC